MESETRVVGAERAGEERVTPLELFFDLVFVLSFTQVTLKMAENPGWESLGEGLLILAAVWWAWCAYAWLTNSIDPDSTLNRVCMFSAMGGMLIVSLSIPDAFGDRGVLFGCAYFFVRAMQLVLYVRNTPGASADGDLQAILKLAPGFLVGSALLIVAGFLDDGARASVWILAILIDWTTPLLFGTEDFHLDPGHFAERHGLIVMIALGESILAIGAAAGFTLSTGQVFAALLGIAVVAALWWAYFDVVAIVAARRLASRPPGAEQNAMARDSYSYLHFPMVAGIVLVALGMKKTLGHVGDPLKLVPTFALLGGTALYLLAHVAFRLRNVHTLNRRRLGLALLLLALVPAVRELPALALLALLAALLTALISYETRIYGEARDRIRHQSAHELGGGGDGS
jgi:low temperature requirement protein LtrA